MRTLTLACFNERQTAFHLRSKLERFSANGSNVVVMTKSTSGHLRSYYPSTVVDGTSESVHCLRQVMHASFFPKPGHAGPGEDGPTGKALQAFGMESRLLDALQSNLQPGGSAILLSTQTQHEKAIYKSLKVNRAQIFQAEAAKHPEQQLSVSFSKDTSVD